MHDDMPAQRMVEVYDHDIGEIVSVALLARRGVWAAVVDEDAGLSGLVHLPTGTVMSDEDGYAIESRDHDDAINLVRALEPWADFGHDLPRGAEFQYPPPLWAVISAAVNGAGWR